MRDTIYIVPTLPLSTRTLRIIGALIISGALMGGAYVLSGPSFLSSRLAGAESTDELLAQYAAKDSDTDGLPDWQESLYGTNPAVADTDGDGVSDGEAARSGLLTTQRFLTDAGQTPVSVNDIPGITPAPGTLTEEFSRAFFEAYMSNWQGTPLTAEQQDALVERLLGDFSTRARAELTSNYTAAAVKSGNTDVLSYAAAVESIIRQNEVKEGEGQPVMLAHEFIENSDRSALAKLETLSASYRAIANGLVGVTAPVSLRDEHLALIRAFDTLAKSTGSLAEYEQDPLAVLGGLALLQPSSKEIVLAMEGIATEILVTGTPAAGAPGALIVSVAAAASNL